MYLRRQASDLVYAAMVSRYDRRNFDGGPKQASTTVPISVLLDTTTDLHGCLIFAERPQVASAQWWLDHGRDVRVVVQCTHGRTRFRYPPRIAATSLLLRMDPEEPAQADIELEQHWKRIRQVLKEGGDVVLHCESSFHRGPIIGAAIYKRATGIKTEVMLICKTFLTYSFSEPSQANQTFVE